jgi:prepilin-type N-terminal cleavage/methylation domain-containing protein
VLKKNIKNKNAYTLLELSIVISVIAILMMGGLSISIGALNKAKINSTNQEIIEIYNAIGKFLLVNKRLPCPASIILDQNDVNFGKEVGNGNGCSGFSGVYQSSTAGMTNIVYGMVPHITLELSNEYGVDEFRNRFSYFIDQRFTRNFQNTPNFANDSFGTEENYGSVFTILEKPSTISRNITNDAILVILSHGLNRFGGFAFDSGTQNSRSADADELENDYNSSFNNTFVTSSQNSSIFDDILLFKTRNQIVEDFNAFYLIACKDAGVDFGYRSAYYDQNIYGNSKCASLTYDRLPEKYCDKYGNWVEINKCTN